MPTDFQLLQQEFANQNYLFTSHASDRAAQRGILSHEIEEAITNGEIIEDYPDDKYGPSCLIMGETDSGRMLHIQVSYAPGVKIITVYEPSSDEWEADMKTRKT